MEIITRNHGDVLIVELPGEGGGLIRGSMNDFINALKTELGESTCKIALDLSGKSYLNSVGLKDLFQAYNLLLDFGYDVFILNPAERVGSLLNIAGLNTLMTVIHDEKELNEQGTS